MTTALEKMIEVVEKGYYENKTLWNEWKDTLLELEKDQLKDAFLAGDDASFHHNISDITSFKDYWEFLRKQK